MELVANQYCEGLEPSLNSVPPTQVEYGELHIPFTAAPDAIDADPA